MLGPLFSLSVHHEPTHLHFNPRRSAPLVQLVLNAIPTRKLLTKPV
jgi:hypothetical protein